LEELENMYKTTINLSDINRKYVERKMVKISTLVNKLIDYYRKHEDLFEKENNKNIGCEMK